MMTTWMKRRPILIVVGAGLLVVAGLLVITALLRPESAVPTPESTATVGATETTAAATAVPDTATPEADLSAAQIAASVNGYTITQSYLSQTVKLNAVLGELSGASVLGEKETLQRLIRSQLILQGVSSIEEPSDEDVEAFISSLEQNWGVSDGEVAEELDAVGLERAFLEDTIKRLLTVQAGVESLESDGLNVTDWLEEQEKDADIMVYEDLVSAEETEATPVSEATSEIKPPTATPGPQPEVPAVAPDFALDQAGGGTFALNDHLKEGPVVLVFFQKCG